MKKTALCLALVLSMVLSLASCDMLDGILGGVPGDGEHTHTPSEYITDREPTCIEKGSRYIKCTECDEVILTEEIDFASHTPEDIPGKEATETEDGATAGSRCKVCGEIITAPENIPADISGLDVAVSGFEREGDVFRIRLASSITSVSLKDALKVNSRATLLISYDPEGSEVVNPENIALEPGDNTIYATVTVDGESKAYTLIIRRATTYNVSFVLADGTVLHTSTVEEGAAAALPDITRAGYTLATEFDFSQPIIADTEIEVFWDGKGVEYTVLHYFESLSGGYELCERVTQYGELGDTGVATPGVYVGYSVNEDLGAASGEIVLDGSLELSIYYDLKVYTVSIEGISSEIISGVGEYKHGAQVNASLGYIPLGYEFLGWTSGEVVLSTELEYSSVIESDVVAKFKVKDDIAPFIFESSDVECTITGIRDTSATALIIPEYVTYVASGAFSGCTSLTDLTVLGTNTVIEDDAFLGCPILRAEAPVGALSSLPKKKLTELTVNGGGEIPEAVMQNSPRLAVLVIGDGVTKIGASAFANSINLVSVTLGPDVAVIEDGAFTGARKLRDIVNLSALELKAPSQANGEIAARAWSIVTTESQIERIGDYLFYEHEFTQGTVIKTKYYMMAYVGADTEITLPESPTFNYYLHDFALARLEDVKSIYIPSSVLEITEGSQPVFSGCSSLESLTMPCRTGDMPLNTPTYESVGTLFGTVEYENSVPVRRMAGYGGNYSTFYIPSGLKNVTILGNRLFASYVPHDYFKEIPAIETLTIDSADTTVSIAPGAFAIVPNLKNVVIKGYASFGNYAFLDTVSLVSVSGDKVSSIGEFAFKNCTALKTVDLISASRVEASAFIGCSSLESFSIEHGISIGDNAFCGCSSLKTVIVEDLIGSIGASAFESCTALKTLDIAVDGDIGSKAFHSCTSLTEYSVPATLDSIGSNAFASCTSLKSVSFENAKQLKSIGEYCFNDCPSLTSVTFGNYITEIASNTFRYCTSLESITIPANLVTIGSYAFTNCTSLAEIVTEGTHVFKTDVFKECNKIEKVYAPSLETWLANTFGSGILNGADLYLGGVLFTEFVLPTNVTTITNHAFEGCGSLTKVTLPAHATWFGLSIFSNCVNVKEAIIENGVTEIPGYAFLGCSSLGTFNIPSSVKKIGGGALGSCASLVSIEIPSSVTEIGQQVFAGSALTEITIPGSISIIPKSAFQNCKSLKTVTLGEGVGRIVDYAFKGCTALESISIPASVSKVDSSAFSGCSGIDVYAVSLAEWLGISFSGSESNPLVGGGNLYFGGALAQELDITGVTALSIYAFEGAVSIKSVTVRADVQTVGVYAFSGCTNLASIIIEEGVTSIGYYAFNNCSSLKEINIPASATLGEKPFAGCTSLERAVLGNSVPSFSGCTALKEVVILEGVTEISLAYFNGCTNLKSIVIPASVTKFKTPAFTDRAYRLLLSFYQSLDLDIYYCGDSLDGYNAISGRSMLSSSADSTVYIYSANTPSGEGSFWCYDDNGEIVVWS